MTAEAPLLNVSPVDARLQHRSAADVGAAGPGPRLDVARAARAGQPHDGDGQRAGAGPRRRPRVPAEHGRPAGDAATSAPAASRASAATRSREFQFISNRFDATQGRSSGVQVNAITKSGTNSFAASFAGNFRNSDWNAEDPVLGVKVPLRNQQFSGTFGGPILRDRLHFFANYEYDRVPQTTIWNTPFPAFNITLDGQGERRSWAACASTTSCRRAPADGEGQPDDVRHAVHAARQQPPGRVRARRRTRHDNLQAQFTQVLSNRAVNEIKVGYAGYGFTETNLTTWSNHSLASARDHQRPPAHPVHRLQHHRQQQLAAPPVPGRLQPARRLHVLVRARGRHDLKAGGEFLWRQVHLRQLHELHGPHRRARTVALPSAAQHGGAGSRIRSTPTPGTSTRSRASRAATSSASPTRSRSPFNQPKYAGVAAGRLAASPTS